MADDKNKENNEFKRVEALIGDQEIGRWEKKAQKYLDDPEKTQDLLNTAFKKASNNRQVDPVNKIWERIKLLISLVKDWVDGEYRQVAKTSLVLIIAGIIYFVTPLDVIPDWILGFGILDDATVLALIINRLDREISLYNTWKKNKMTRNSQ